VALDTKYIANWNIWLDIRIIWKTIQVVFNGKGAA
ncbi:sugar transferase, partial [Ohessyouella blattaphilus]